MSRTGNVPWFRIGAESVAIIVSILLAFSIDAWWQGRLELEQADTLVANLYSDFQASQAHLEEKLEEHDRLQRHAEGLLASIARMTLDRDFQVERNAILNSILAPTYSPTTSALELAFASGQIDLIEDYDLRDLLASWRQLVADIAEEELLISDINNHQLIPEFSKVIRLGDILNADSITLAVEVDTVSIALRPTAELEAALGQRVFFGNFVVDGLTQLHEMQLEILRRLEQRISE